MSSNNDVSSPNECPMCHETLALAVPHSSGDDGGRPASVLPCLHRVCRPCSLSSSSTRRCVFVVKPGVCCGAPFETSRILFPPAGKSGQGAGLDAGDHHDHGDLAGDGDSATASGGWPTAGTSRSCCSECDDPATHHCETCDEPMCSLHNDAHRRSNKSKNHTVRQLEVAHDNHAAPPHLTGCRDHPGVDVSFYCGQCMTLVCKTCIVKNHRGHEMLSFAEAADKAAQDIAARSNKLQTRVPQIDQGIDAFDRTLRGLKSRLHSNLETVDEQYNSLIDELHKRAEQLEQRRDQIRSDLIQSTDHTTDKLNACQNDLILLREHILLTQERLKDTSGNGNGDDDGDDDDTVIHKLRAKTQVAERIAHLQDVRVPLMPPPFEAPTFLFTPPVNVVLEDVATMGSIIMEQVEGLVGDDDMLVGASDDEFYDDQIDDDLESRAEGTIYSRSSGSSKSNSIRSGHHDDEGPVFDVHATLVNPSSRRHLNIKPTVGTIGRSARANVGSVSKYTVFGAPSCVVGGPMPGKEPLLFNSPIGIAVLPNGAVIVSEWSNERIQTMTTDGAHLRTINVKTNVAGVSTTKTGEIWAALRDRSRARLYTPIGAVLRDLPCPLASIAVQLDDDDILVGCGGANCVKLFDRDGHEKWSSLGDGFKYIYSLVPMGNEVAVCDTKNNRLQVLSLADGKYQRSIGKGQVNTPSGVAYDPFARVLIVAESDRMSVWTPQGSLVHRWGKSGSEPGQFNNGFGSCTLSPDGTVGVVDWGNHRVQFFS